MLSCVSCGAVVAAHEFFCEECGAELSPTQPAPAAELEVAPITLSTAAATTKTPDEDADAALLPTCPQCTGRVEGGYCSRCGAPEGLLRDHFSEVPAAWLAGVSDRGVRHHRNEDALALAADPVPTSFGAIVVCDGVSSAPASDVAALAAARAAREVLVTGRSRVVPDRPGRSAADPAGLLLDAVLRANAAASGEEAPGPAPGAATGSSVYVPRAERPPEEQNAAACTFVGAVIGQDRVTVANVGDSRGYWIGDDGTAHQLTVDDSMAQLHMSMGVDRETAENGPQAHAITRWLGADSPGLDIEPVTFRVPGDGWLLLCSDGLWNYASEPGQLVTLIREAAHAGVHDPADLAARLTRWACNQGGRDNITVALARFGTRQDVRTLPAADTEPDPARTHDTIGAEPDESDAAAAATRHTGPQAASESD